jgi:methylated-DNA-[protein]-cysteine S-methyltransferase
MSDNGALTAGQYQTPAGDLWVVIEPASAVVRATTFRDLDDAVRRLPAEIEVVVDDPDMRIARALSEYSDGDPHALDRVQVNQPGSVFRQSVWESMRTIEFGDVSSYAELAESAGNPRAYRAVGTACAENLVALFVPCHRVVASMGIGGYGYGLDVKHALLAHEKASDPRIK